MPKVPFESKCPLWEFPFILPFCILRYFVFLGCNIFFYFKKLLSTTWLVTTSCRSGSRFSCLLLGHPNKRRKFPFTKNLTFHYPYFNTQSTISSMCLN